MYVLFSLGWGLMSEVRLMVMGRWSEPKVMCTCQVEYGRMEAEAREMSGEEGCWLLPGSLVGFSVLSMPYVELLISLDR